jgi:arylsulfatase A-like enzyme
MTAETQRAPEEPPISDVAVSRPEPAAEPTPTPTSARASTPAHVSTPEPGLARRIRGRGFVTAVATFALVGVADGVVAITRTPPGGRGVGFAVWLVFHCTVVLASAGLFAGLAQEFLLAAAARRPVLQAAAAWLLGGPRRWFARDERVALGVVMAAVTVLPAIGMLLPVTWYVINFFHSRVLMASALPIASAVLLAASAVLAVVVAWPLGWLLRRAPDWVASPGTALLGVLVATGLETARVVSLNWTTYRYVDGRPALAAAVVAAVDLGGLLLFTRRRAPLRWRTLGAVAGGGVLMFLVSGFTLGSRQDVVVAVSQRSIGTRSIIVPLQHLVDLDGDGYGMLFGGGDCSDFDRTRNPGARDVPGNGVDENCSGADGRRESQNGDGRMVALPPALAANPPSIVFLSIDAVRPDHTSLYGYRRNTTPQIARWAAASGVARFTRAYCTSPRSLRSFASVFTGRYPSGVIWGRDNQFPPLADENATLAELLHERGYATAAFVNSDYFARTRGFFQGFDEHHEGRTFKDDAAAHAAQAVDWLRHRVAEPPRPFFAWIHIIDPHGAYNDRREPAEFGHGLMDTYDEEIAYADMFAGRVLAAVDEVAAHQPTYVVVFSDHGEAFGEHGYMNHSWDLHEEATRVMLLARGPGIAPGDRGALVSLFDLFPTALNLAGRASPAPIPSESLLGVLLGTTRRMPRDRLFFEVTPDGTMSAEQRAVVEPPYKLLYDFQRQSWELYDLSRDPRETRNLYDDESSVAGRLRERVLNWFDTDGLRTNRTADVIAAARLTREPRMQRPMHVRFGAVAELLGFDMPRTTYRVGDSVQLTIYLRVLGRTTRPANVAVVFEREDRQWSWAHFNMTHYPLGGRYMTTQWRPGEMLRDEMERRIDPEVAPGRYRVLFSIEHDGAASRYPPSRGGRPSNDVELGIIEITR